MGMHDCWEKLEQWLHGTPILRKYEPAQKKNKVLCPDLPILDDYTKDPPDSYWASFPKNEFPKHPTCEINIDKFKAIIEQNKSKLSKVQLDRAHRCIVSLEQGADSFQKLNLPGCQVANAANLDKYGREVADTIASWVQKKFVAGPFDQPPVKKFRGNKLLAIQQNEKVRPVLDLSEPEGFSFNDNVQGEKLEKVTMSSSKKFGRSLFEAGKDSKFSKSDFVDAYKNVPVKMHDLHLQGFSWKNKFFIETRQVFGAKTAVQNFDILANTIVSVVNSEVQVPTKFIHRTLDDVPVISPACENWTEKFDRSFEKLCDNIAMKLAPECEKKEKAFKSTTQGKVLGTHFDSSTLSWKSPDEKRHKYLNCIRNVLLAKTVSLLEMQSLMGCLNHAGQLAPFLAGFRFNLNKALGFLQTHPEVKLYLSQEARQDLKVWANFLEEEGWHPLPGPYFAPPIAYKEFISDAAGCQSDARLIGKIGCGNVGFSNEGHIIFAHQLWWSEKVIRFTHDKHGKRLGAKTTTLEFLGIILPFLLIPKKLVNQHIVVKMDNAACFFGWINKHAPCDEMASILIRSLHLISAYLGSQIHISHLPRLSNWEACLVDRLSRSETTTREDRRLLNSFPGMSIPKALEKWMKDPKEDWKLPVELLKSVKSSIHDRK
jgi:hypothetical protein